MIATFYFTLSGLFIGSFLNVCIDRLPRSRSLVYPPSHCEACQHRLAWYDLLPVASYLALRGRCRYCGARILPRLAIVEALTGALLGYVGHRFGLSTQAVILALYIAILLAIAVMDLERMVVLNSVIFPATAVALFLSPLLPDVGLLDPLYGALLGFGALLAAYLLSRGGMGAGDVKLAACIGAANGFPLVLVSLVLAILSAGTVAVFLLTAKLKGRKDVMPFGTFLATAAIVTLLWGQTIQDTYLDLIHR